MSAFLPDDSSLGAVLVTQGIGDADPCLSALLQYLSDFNASIPAFVKLVGFLPGEALFDISTVEA